MKGTKFQLSMLLAVVMIAGFISPSFAEIDTLEVELFGFVNQDDARQIRRLLLPWADPEDVNFKPAYDKKGRQRHFTTIVEVTPRRGPSKYSEGHVFDIYDIMRQLNDSRFRGGSGTSDARVIKADAKVTGVPYAHAGFARSYIRNVPFWRRWRSETSAVYHAVDLGEAGQKMVFSDNKGFDLLREKAGDGARLVEIEGQIAGFDGPYPVMSVRKFRVEYVVEPEEGGSGEEETLKKKPVYDYLGKEPEVDEADEDE